ncbi:MAG: PD40 domain-containing protein [Anaerolineae bacterium]|nr:PD40 domain-containing protein [Anaerolineae bacterium]
MKIVAVIIALLVLISIAWAVLSALRFQPEEAILYWDVDTMYRFEASSKQSYPLEIQTDGNILSATFDRNNGEIAFADANGLKTAFLNGDSQQLLITHEKEILNQDTLYRVKYVPLEWSPHGDYILLRRIGYETAGIFQFSRTDGLLQPLPALHYGGVDSLQCETGLSWSPDEDAIVTGIWGIGFCDGNGGIFVIKVPSLTVEKIFTGTLSLIPPDQEVINLAGGSAYMKWSPDGQHIAFVQDEYFPEEQYHSLLMLIDPQTRQTQVVVNSAEGDITTPLWSPDSQQIYYLIDHQPRLKRDHFYFEDQIGVAQDEIYKVDVNSGQSTRLYAGHNLELVSISPQGEWIAFLQWESEDGSETSRILWLLHTSTKQLVQVSEIQAEPYSSGFIGWEIIE